VVEVGEEGTEAAGTTAVAVAANGDRTYEFRADHPFLFLIRDLRRGVILFIGRVSNPQGT
jgi:serpin B